MALKMKWKSEKDEILIKELFIERPWEKMSGTKERSSSWEKIANVFETIF